MNRLREVRVVKRVSQYQLRLLTGVSQTKNSLIENNFVNPREEEMKRFAKALGCRVDEIFSPEKPEIFFRAGSAEAGK